MAQLIATENLINRQDLARQDNHDVAESVMRRMDNSVRETTGIGLFHILTIGSIVASIAFYASGKKSLGIFIGLWPPTFEALKAAAERGGKDA